MLHDINARIGEIDAELESLAALTDPTDDDVARTEELLAEREQRVAERLAAVERTERIAEAYAKAKSEGRAFNGGSFEHMKRVDPYVDDVRMMTAEEIRDASRSLLERPESRHLDADSKEKAEKLLLTMDQRLARWTLSTSRPQYRSAFGKYATGRGDRLTSEERLAVDQVEYEARTYMALADANGGYAVPALLDPSVIYTGNGSANPFRQIGRIVTGIDDTWRGVSSGGVTASWDAEAAEVSDDSPTFAQPTVPAYKGAAFAGMSVEIEGDWPSIASAVSELFAEAKDTLEATAYATGTGSAQPTGIVTALVAGSGTVANVAPTTDGSLGVVDVRALFAALPPRYRSNASWVMSLDVMNEVRGFDTTGGMSLQTVDLTAPYSFQLLGRPVYEASAMDSFTGTTGVANLMVVGDFSRFVIFDRIGARLEVIPHLVSSNYRPTGQRGLYFWWRTGSDSVADNSFRLLRNS